jgi:hypothetical protein
VVDSSELGKVAEVRDCLKEVLACEELKGVPLLLLFNKSVSSGQRAFISKREGIFVI